MNCGIYCVREYLRLKNINEQNIIERLESELNEKGISVFAITKAFRENGMNMKAAKVKNVPNELPVILYLPSLRHFILVIRKDRLFFYIADNLLGFSRIPRPFFRFLFSNVCLMMI
ncbi:MAG: hypothetical protein II712_03800 [Erysipelotrichaceae bacterium]|nr:hypothetical protein [Erysipelotrichaceae bacterium]